MYAKAFIVVQLACLGTSIQSRDMCEYSIFPGSTYCDHVPHKAPMDVNTYYALTHTIHHTTHTRTRTHAHTHTRTHAHTHTRTHTHTHTRTHAYAHAHTHTRTHAHTHTRTHSTRTHTNTHTRTRALIYS